MLCPLSYGRIYKENHTASAPRAQWFSLANPSPFRSNKARSPPWAFLENLRMTARNLSFILAGLVLLAAAPPASAQSFFLKKGDVVVVMGDSITEQRLYSNYLELWSQTRFPGYNLVFRNVGIGGDRSTGGNGRFKRDVLAHKPTVLTVDFGMNDGNYKAFNEKTFDVYMKGLQGIADQAKAAGIRVAWVTPQPTERREAGNQLAGYNETLKKYS